MPLNNYLSDYLQQLYQPQTPQDAGQEALQAAQQGQAMVQKASSAAPSKGAGQAKGGKLGNLIKKSFSSKAAEAAPVASIPTKNPQSMLDSLIRPPVSSPTEPAKRSKMPQATLEPREVSRDGTRPSGRKDLQLNNLAYNKAQQFKGMNETRQRQVLQKFFKKAGGLAVDPKKTAWCAAFANSVLKSQGGSSTGSLMAKSFLNWGKPVNKPQQGDVVVLHRTKDPRKGHVGFYAGHDKAGNIMVLGGNQDNQVSIKSYPANRLAGYRRAP